MHYHCNPFGNLFAEYSSCEAEYAEYNKAFCEMLADLPRHAWLVYNIQTLSVTVDDDGCLESHDNDGDYYGLLHMEREDGVRLTIPIPVLQAIFHLSFDDLIQILNGDWFRLSAGSWAK